MTKKLIAIVDVDMKDGSFASGFVPVKSKKQFAKIINKMMDKGEMQLGSLRFDFGDIEQMNVEFEGVN